MKGTMVGTIKKGAQLRKVGIIKNKGTIKNEVGSIKNEGAQLENEGLN